MFHIHCKLHENGSDFCFERSHFAKHLNLRNESHDEQRFVFERDNSRVGHLKQNYWIDEEKPICGHYRKHF